MEGLAKLARPNMDIVDAFFFSLLYRPDLEICNNPHLDILVNNESSQYFYTLGYCSTATAFISLTFEDLVNRESELDPFFSFSGDTSLISY